MNIATEEQLLKLYKTEIESGKVKVENLIAVNNLLNTDFTDRILIRDTISKNFDFIDYLMQNTFYCVSDELQWLSGGGEIPHVNKEIGERLTHRLAKYLKILVQTNAFKEISF
ncbi:hypothetical protein NTJ12_002524 [Flavobacterium psychrophilum]|nr:hypothetical protein [Flavobacterium psychrophilum]